MCGTEQKDIADTPQCGHKRVTHFSTKSSPSSTCCIIFSRLSLSSCNRQVTLHLPFSLSLLLQKARNTHYIFHSLSLFSCNRQQVHLSPHPPPATSKKHTLHFPLALSLLLQQPTTHVASSFVSLSALAISNKYTLHFPLALLLLLRQATTEYTLHLPFFLSSCNRQQVYMTSSLVSVSPFPTTEQHSVKYTYIIITSSLLRWSVSQSLSLSLSLSRPTQQVPNTHGISSFACLSST